LESVNVFKGVLANPYFCTIWVVTSGLQALIVEYGSIAFHVYAGGLPAKYWGISMAFGVGSLPIQQIINYLYRLSKKYKGYRINKRVRKNARQATQQVEAGGLSSERPAGGKDKRQPKQEKND
jgi:Ca2+ transporting ATPase